MWKKLTLIAALLGLVALLVLPLAATGAKPLPGGGKIPPGKGLIALYDFTTGWDTNTRWITLMNPDGTGRTPLVLLDGNISFHPAWSPEFSDGTVKLAYPAMEGVPGALTFFVDVANAFTDEGDGSGLQLAPSVPTRVNHLVEKEDVEQLAAIDDLDWSPKEPEVVNDNLTGRDTVRVAYKVSLRGGRVAVHIVDLIYDPSNASSPFAVAPTMYDDDNGFRPTVLDAGAGASYGLPQFSPDGKLLALNRVDRLPDGTSHSSIWLASADGSGQPWRLIDESGVSNRYPAWSPDGLRLAFLRHSGNKPSMGWDLYVADVQYIRDQQGEIVDVVVVSSRRLTSTNSITEHRPTWSPDGTQIAYGFEGGNIGKVDVATGAQYKLGAGFYPDWSPMELPRLGP